MYDYNRSKQHLQLRVLVHKKWLPKFDLPDHLLRPWMCRTLKLSITINPVTIISEKCIKPRSIECSCPKSLGCGRQTLLNITPTLNKWGIKKKKKHDLKQYNYSPTDSLIHVVTHQYSTHQMSFLYSSESASHTLCVLMLSFCSL